MHDFDILAQQYIYRAIRAAVPSTVAVETRPRNGGPLPYVFLGESAISEHPIGFEMRLSVEIYSDKEGPIECKSLQADIRRALNLKMDAPGSRINEFALRLTGPADASGNPSAWRVALVAEESASAQLEAGNSVWHGTQRFRLLVEESE